MISVKLVFFICCVTLDTIVHSKPQFDLLGGYDTFGICFNNCAQCKKLYGVYFEAERCAQTCITYRGKTIPDCEDVQSIAPFLISLDVSK
uniref:Eclosion hormone n=1 Tax=Anopheles atroparvus TaxID=41427 RepID=A0AAG5DQR1_ANOAO